jgi:hypothetical protein
MSYSGAGTSLTAPRCVSCGDRRELASVEVEPVNGGEPTRVPLCPNCASDPDGRWRGSWRRLTTYDQGAT